jgi:hypothetical protein
MILVLKILNSNFVLVLKIYLFLSNAFNTLDRIKFRMNFVVIM